MMFKINRLKIIVKTANGNFGYDNWFNKRINFIASHENTRGKSSCIEAIYYCLGVEQLIGGQNERSLRPVFRKNLEYQRKQERVLETEFYLQIENGRAEKITVYRTANKDGHSSNLISVYYGEMDKVLNEFVKCEDMYVHSPGAATNQYGFHRFLESFLGWELPIVPNYNDEDRKLYIQTVFSALFIEQKRGWSNVLASIPTFFGIKDARQRVIEFLIGLKILETERQKQQCKADESKIKTDWDNLNKCIISLLSVKNCYLQGVPFQPEILNENYLDRALIMKQTLNQEDTSLEEYINIAKNRLRSLREAKMRVGDNVDGLQEELKLSKKKSEELEQLIAEQQTKLIYENSSIETLKRSLEIINKDLQNNQDALKIKEMGSTQDWCVNKDVCPTCRQKIQDALLPQEYEYNLMSIKENIEHLKSQKTMIEFGLKGHKNNIATINQNVAEIEKVISGLRRIIRSLINDLYATDNSATEIQAYQLVALENEIEDLLHIEMQSRAKVSEFWNLSERWKKLLEKKKDLPKERFTQDDVNRVQVLRECLVRNLRNYGYTSINLDEVEISKDKLLPTVEGFDMRFDSSASDNIRAIWAFTVALMQASKECSGAHPNILIFDEPDQQSIVPRDMENFLRSFTEFDCQVIIGITLKDKETRDAINRMDKGLYNLSIIEDKAIAPITSI